MKREDGTSIPNGLKKTLEKKMSTRGENSGLFHFRNQDHFIWVYLMFMSKHELEHLSQFNNTENLSNYPISGFSRIIYFDPETKSVSRIFEGYIENSGPSRVPFYGRLFSIEQNKCEVGYFGKTGGMHKLSGKGMKFELNGTVKLEGLF